MTSSSWVHRPAAALAGLVLISLAVPGKVAVGTGPILVLFDVHADPMAAPPVGVQQYAEWIDALNWALNACEPRGARISFLSVGQLMEYVLADTAAGHPLIQRLYASGRMIGTHSHSDIQAGPYNWRNLGPNPSTEQVLENRNDHIATVNAVITSALGVSDPAQIRAINCSRGAHIPSDDAERIAMMAAYLAELAGMAASAPPGDFDGDTDVDGDDFASFEACFTGPAIGPPTPICIDADMDCDGDVDQSDFGLVQRCYSGTGRQANPLCMR
ncbi:MAG TPA: hypothetical protein VLM89_10680 [Phycisphaerae bacterium]|nr:hypothetical protein [Phycisphaerae bacterium]